MNYPVSVDEAKRTILSYIPGSRDSARTRLLVANEDLLLLLTLDQDIGFMSDMFMTIGLEIPGRKFTIRVFPSTNSHFFSFFIFCFLCRPADDDDDDVGYAAKYYLLLCTW